MPGTQLRLRRAARLILIGAPGVGKGTHTERLLNRYPQLSSLSSGDMLRENVRNKTPLGKQAQELMSRGALVPDSMILRLIRNALTTRGWLVPKGGAQPLTLNYSTSAEPATRGQADDYLNLNPPVDGDYEYSEEPDASFILDGFPRNEVQAYQLDNMIPINMAIHVHTPTRIILDRICNRWVHPSSGRTYNTTFNPPKEPGRDNVTGDRLVQREDDRPEIWEARLQQFQEASQPLLEHYDKLGVLWKVQGDSSDEISPKIFDEFHRRFGA